MQILKLTKNLDRRLENHSKEVRGIETARAEIAAHLKREQSQRPQLAEAAHGGDAKARQTFIDSDIACIAFQAQLDRKDAALAEAQGRKNAALAERANAVRGDKIATMKDLCTARVGVARRVEGGVAKLAASVDEMTQLASEIEELWKELRLAPVSGGHVAWDSWIGSTRVWIGSTTMPSTPASTGRYWERFRLRPNRSRHWPGRRRKFTPSC